jgi:hypothetical protein
MEKKKTREKVEKFIDEFKTANEQGFTESEIFRLIQQLGGTINMDKFNDAMMGNTCMLINDEIVNYHTDVRTALLCGYEDRNITAAEWD